MRDKPFTRQQAIDLAANALELALSRSANFSDYNEAAKSLVKVASAAIDLAEEIRIYEEDIDIGNRKGEE